MALRIAAVLLTAGLIGSVLLALSHADNPGGDAPWQWTFGRVAAVVLAAALVALAGFALAARRRR